MQARRILVVDDESSLRTALFRVLDRKEYQVITANSFQEALSFSQSEQQIDLVLLDLHLPDGDGLELMDRLRQKFRSLQFIVMTGYASIDNAIQATQKGAFHFVTKPFEIHEIVSLVDRALSHKSLEQENLRLKNELHQKYRFENIIGQSDELMKVLEIIERISDSDSTILITGESGTGKELIARAIHYNSPRANQSIIPVNCGAIPAELLESEIFGHIKGAFTGAIQSRMGRFEMANKGTLFLDEIGDMSAPLQVKLLRVLQERCFEPVGSNKTIDVDVRVIAATNINLEKAVEENHFREDLFYRLNVIPIRIPSLRERVTDIPLLMYHFLQKFNQEKNRNIEGFSPEALELLMKYPWPGNVRELENLMERLSILKGQGIIDIEDLPDRYRQNIVISRPEATKLPDSGVDFNSAVESFENNLILQALKKTNWNRNQAAKLLKLNRTTLVEKIKKKGLRQPEM